MLVRQPCLLCFPPHEMRNARGKSAQQTHIELVISVAFWGRERLTPTAIFAGLAAGLFSTATMSLTEYPIWRRWGMEGVSEWHLNQALMARLFHRHPQDLVFQGLVLHFVHGAVAGIVFALILPVFSQGIPVVEAGVAFGLLLWIIAMLIMKPVTGIGLRNHDMRLLPLVVSLGGHLLYGSLLGLVVGFT